MAFLYANSNYVFLLFKISIDHRRERDMYQGTTSAGSPARAGVARAGVQSRAEQPSGCVQRTKKALGFSPCCCFRLLNVGLHQFLD